MKLGDVEGSAERASAFLKSLGHPHRLRILCLIMEGERPVSAIADAIGLTQSGVSQHLARMRQEGLIKARRDGQTIYYSIADKRAARVVGLLESMFCPPASR
jgi:DNA-binding transcriptional ArsR family regulator